MKITILGCGASAGVPLVGCHCAVCLSDNPKNKRLRVSVYIEHEGARILVDASPDLRQQCLANGITTADAILFTHAHADHCHGMDDIRTLNYHKDGPIDVYADDVTLEELRARFGYAFEPHDTGRYPWYKPWLIPHALPLDALHPFHVSPEVKAIPFAQGHGKITTLGFRLGNFAYSTDVDNLPEESFSMLEGVRVWVVDCLRDKPAPTHAHRERTLEWISRVKPERAILTHMSHDLEYEALKSSLPEGVEPGYDGMAMLLPP